MGESQRSESASGDKECADYVIHALDSIIQSAIDTQQNTQNVHRHHFIIRATQFGPELQVLLAALGQGNGRPVDLGLGRTDALSKNMASYVRSTDYVGLKPTRKADDLLVFDDGDVADLVRAAVKREGSQAAFAKRYDIDRTDVSAFLNGRRGISASLAKALGLRRVYIFE